LSKSTVALREKKESGKPSAELQSDYVSGQGVIKGKQRTKGEKAPFYSTKKKREAKKRMTARGGGKKKKNGRNKSNGPRPPGERERGSSERKRGRRTLKQRVLGWQGTPKRESAPAEKIQPEPTMLTGQAPLFGKGTKKGTVVGTSGGGERGTNPCATGSFPKNKLTRGS